MLTLLTFAVSIGCGSAIELEGASDADSAVDAAPDTASDGLIDAAPDTSEVGDDPGPPCTYPPGPYRFDSVGDIVGPATWPSGIKASGESSWLDQADFEAFYCDPEVQSIGIFIATLSDPYCPPRIAELVSVTWLFETYGTKWIWLLAWDGGVVPTNAMARSYFEEQGVTFGWFTDDADNSLGAYTFNNNDMLGGGVPWIGVIDAKTMRVYASNPSDIFAIVESLGTD